MPVPQEILSIPRPVNTIVEDRGRDTPKRFAVRERSFIKYVPGGNSQPHNGKVIGHIVNGEFIPIQGRLSQEPTVLSYGAPALIKKVAEDIYSDLLDIYDINTSTSIMAIASLKIMYNNIAANRMHSFYKKTFLSKFYPAAALSSNSISKLYELIGINNDKICKFYEKRILKIVADHHVVIDGTLKEDNSKVNDLSAFSYKSRIKGTKDISILYAYDIDLMEPICATVFAGNIIDASAYKTFITENKIENGIIIADKGFPPSKIYDNRPNLHYITPIKRNDKRIHEYNLTDFEGELSGLSDIVYYKKIKISDNLFLYSFLNQKDANNEAIAYGQKTNKEKSFDPEKYKKKKDLFGVIVLESDLDIDPKIIYSSYEDRWLIELVFRRYKSDLCFDDTRVQSDFSVRGAELVNFISTLITCRIIRIAEKTGLLEQMTYGHLLDELKSAWRKIDAPEQATSDDGFWMNMTSLTITTLETLGLSKAKTKPEARKRGRPRKNPVEEPQPKRPVGRPRKNPVEETSNDD